ncbi:hypothetical protein L198_01673 [Cryptococcus wingfieldii CBS 7118]|uniref:AAA protein C-terminal winged helix domain-containing protein n=1 Tax=Cryptococcus wingfieldii CBS 7118 TaxID=1295528 RepID=A0A1E3K089_9TREE|nr:hypothetical protein L198_01673 [Cryptococcus wingfieldii CBS 7118]ODO06441.1 hypothetical protein L198_01673 [Cryptococcus wingfieldii CBS 7118]
MRATVLGLARRQLLHPQPRHINQFRLLSSTAVRRDVPSWPNPPVPQSPVGPSDSLQPQGGSSGSGKGKERWWDDWLKSASFQAALTTIVGLGMVFGSGIGYLEWYKDHVLRRIMRAFEPGYDPALELSKLNGPNSSHVKRREQPLIDRIVRGEEKGGYYLIIGPKGSGKGTMVLDAMRKINADGVSFCESHPDLEVFRLRFGKALDFDFYEDWQGSLFSRADPRNGGPALDIERALNKLEKVALRYALKNGRPLVMAFNNIHLFPNTEEGHSLIHQLQQRAEAWAEGGILTMVFSSDDYWCLDVMKKNASRMRILSVYDLSATESLRALRHLRRQEITHRLSKSGTGGEVQLESDQEFRRVYELVGGRTSYLARVARADNMIDEAEAMIESEKQWLLSKIGLIPEHDDDVMDEQKWASCSWLILRHLAQAGPALTPYPPALPSIPSKDDVEYRPVPDNDGEHVRSSSSVNITPPVEISSEDLVLPKVTFEEARRIMTRADFLGALDHYHVVAIDLQHNVRPDSTLLLRAAQQVVAVEGFDKDLDTTRDRVDQIEGLHRQNELTVKEPFRVMFDKRDGKPVWEVIGLGESFVPEGDDEEEERQV